MEIITCVREGAITHEDSLGDKGRSEAGDVQVMSAGTAIRHGEFNRDDGTTKIFQIWIEPSRSGEPPAWGARPFPKGARSGSFVALASGMANDGDALPIGPTPVFSAPPWRPGETSEYTLGAGRHAYLAPSRGSIEINGVRLGERDGAAIADESLLRITALGDAEPVLVDAL